MQFYKTAMDLSKAITLDLLRKMSDDKAVPDAPAYFIRYMKVFNSYFIVGKMNKYYNSVLLGGFLK